jgi:UDP-N-acetylmuramate dehydrogenase
MLMINETPLLERLPIVNGEYVENFNLGRVTWFKVGGPAEVAFAPADLTDLRHFLAETPRDIPVTIMGAGSNLLVRDGGVAGVVIRLGACFSKIKICDDIVKAGAMAMDIQVARAAARAHVAGLEFLSGVPGAIGGALRMNAGAYGTEIKDVLVRARAVDRDGVLNVLLPDAFGFSYRHCTVPEDWIFVGADLMAQPGDPVEINARMAEIAAARGDAQPIRTRTGGSTFKNPDSAKAWELIDQAGCRGLAIGGAKVSEQHCNFLINTGSATADDLENLGEEVRRRVQDKSGVTLEWEVKRIGVSLDGSRGAKSDEETRHG